jgi:hypothetical protein
MRRTPTSSTTGAPAVHFFMMPTGILLRQAQELDPDRDWRYFYSGKDAWIIQTWLRLKALGYPVTLSDRVPERGLVVFHKEDQRALVRRLRRDSCPVLVAVRADFRSADSADFEILQNGYFADQLRSFYMPHWPQPGLLPRDSARGTRVERVAFKGDVTNLEPSLRSAAFQQFLRLEGLSFVTDMTQPSDAIRPIKANWNDYREVDVVLALRPAGASDYTHKPPTKLINAWIAGVGAVLGGEYAFRELRRGPLDYLEIRTANGAQEALALLKRDPSLYQRMQENAERRAADYTVARTAQRWAKLLFETLPQLAARHRSGYYSRDRRALRAAARKLKRLLSRTARK